MLAHQVFSPTELLHFLQELPVAPVSCGQIRYVTIWKLRVRGPIS